MSENQCSKYSFQEFNGKLPNKKKRTTDRRKYICSPTDTHKNVQRRFIHNISDNTNVYHHENG